MDAKLIQLGILGFFTITGLVLMFKTSEQLNANIAFEQIARTNAPLVTDINPCEQIQCGPGMKAFYVGDDNTALTELHPYGGNKICQCPDGRTIITQPYTLRRYT